MQVIEALERTPGGPQQFCSGPTRSRGRRERQRRCCESPRRSGCAVYAEHVLCPGSGSTNRKRGGGSCCRSGAKFDGHSMREAMVYSCATVQIIGFAAFFLDGIQGNDVVAHLINVSSCGASGGDPGGTVLSIPLRLVRTQ